MSNLITEISAGASGAAAIGTLLLACATFSMSKHARKSAKEAETANKQTQEVIKQNEQHHMDDSRPILMIYSSSGKDLEELENRAAMIQCPDNPKSSQNKISLIIDGNIKNIGKGIATNIKINIKFLKNERMLLIQDYQPIEPGESVIIGGSDFRSHQKEHSDFVDENNNFKKSFYNSICGNTYGWIMYLHYEDIYGNKFVTTHDLEVEKTDENGNKIIPWAQFSKIEG